MPALLADKKKILLNLSGIGTFKRSTSNPTIRIIDIY